MDSKETVRLAGTEVRVNIHRLHDKAASQYRKTRSELLKLAQEPNEDAQEHALAAVAAYTQTFNRMRFIPASNEPKSEGPWRMPRGSNTPQLAAGYLIETEERDDISVALWGILDALPEGGLQKNALMDRFEELRDF